MLEAYRNGEDLHRTTAALINGIEPSEVTKDQRQAAKAVNSGLIYGMGALRLKDYAKQIYGLELTDDEATQYRNRFFDTYATLRRWQREAARKAERDQVSWTPGGRCRDFRNEAKINVYTESLNTPGQGGGADVLMATLGKLGGCLDGLDAELVNDVACHNSVKITASHRGTQPLCKRYRSEGKTTLITPKFEAARLERTENQRLRGIRAGGST